MALAGFDSYAELAAAIDAPKYGPDTLRSIANDKSAKRRFQKLDRQLIAAACGLPEAFFTADLGRLSELEAAPVTSDVGVDLVGSLPDGQQVLIQAKGGGTVGQLVEATVLRYLDAQVHQVATNAEFADDEGKSASPERQRAAFAVLARGLLEAGRDTQREREAASGPADEADRQPAVEEGAGA